MILIPKYQNLVRFGGNIAIAHFGPDGDLIEDRYYSNVVVGIGKEYIARKIIDSNGTTPAVMSRMAIGGTLASVSTTPTKPTYSDPEAVTGMTTGGTPALAERARVTVTGSNGTVATTAGNDKVVTYTATFPAQTPNVAVAIVEAGIFNADAGVANQYMLCVTSFDVVNKAVNDSITITWTVTIQ